MMQIILFSAERAAANHLWQSTLFPVVRHLA